MAQRNNMVLKPNLGMFLDRPSITIPKRGLVDCLNVRIKDGRIMRDNMGWSKFLTTALNGAVTLIDNFLKRTEVQFLIFGTTKDLYEYNQGPETVSFLTPRYETGTVDVTNGSAVVDGIGTLWLANLKVGDAFHAGNAAQRDPTVVWYTILTVDSDTQITLTANYAEANDTGLAYTGRKLFTGDIRDYWRTETFLDAQPADDDLWFATNGIDDGVKWNGTDNQVTLLTGLGFTFRALREFKNMMLYMDITVGGERRGKAIRNSALTAPENVTTLEASETVIGSGVDIIQDALPLGDLLAVYGGRSVTLAQFVGGTLNFIFREVIAGVGPLSGRAIADFGDFHQFLGADAQYLFDGIRVREIGSQVWRDILRRQSPQRLGSIVSHFDEENGDLLWGFPLNTDADTEAGPIENAYVEHYLEQVGDRDEQPVTFRDFPATATGFFERVSSLRFSDLAQSWESTNFRWNDRFFQAAFPFNLFGDENGNVFILNDQDSQDGASITSFARFGRRMLADGREKAVVRRIYPLTERIPATGNDLTVRLHTAEQADGDTTNTGDLTFDMNHAGNHFVSPRKAGRFMEVEFRTVGASNPWFLAGYDFDLAPAGSR